MRLKYITDIVNGIKTIKAYCWEKIFYNKVEKSRENQLKYIHKSHIVTWVSLMFIMSSGYLMSIILFGYHWGVGRQITYSSSAAALTMITYISFRNLMVFFRGVKMMIMLNVVWTRADEIMQMESNIENLSVLQEDDLIDLAINCRNLTATWGFQILKDTYTGEVNGIDKATNNLININFDARKSDLIWVTGPVGSGKSTLLAAIMNELEVVEGEVKTRGKICYVEQEPFIMSQSIKENILFGESLDEERLNEVINLCWLDQDIELFEQGINTIIGERGIDLSGGQKARISLARAVYSNSDIYLLDDPLSALDHKVGKKIFDNWIKSFLNQKWIILVTHQVQLLKDEKKILYMEQGKLIDQGTYRHLNKSNRYIFNFYSF